MGAKRGHAMNFFRVIAILFLVCRVVSAETMEVGGIEFAYRVPTKHNSDSRIMVLFGGRNWKGERALQVFKFDDLADKYNLFLLSPSFKDNEYWQPEKWSGKVLKEAVKKLEKDFGLKRQKLFFYGYSAGGQCSNLFYNFMPTQVEAWGLHACGVYPYEPVKRGVPAFITCGVKDSERLSISRTFVYRYRENGGRLIFKTYSGGHELNKEALEFAKAFFVSQFEKRKANFVGDDDSMRLVPMGKVSQIDPENRNYLYSDELKKLWEAK